MRRHLSGVEPVYVSGGSWGRFVPETIIHFLARRRAKEAHDPYQDKKFKIENLFKLCIRVDAATHYAKTHTSRPYRIVVGWHAATEFIFQLFVWQTHLYYKTRLGNKGRWAWWIRKFKAQYRKPKWQRKSTIYLRSNQPFRFMLVITFYFAPYAHNTRTSPSTRLVVVCRIDVFRYRVVTLLDGIILWQELFENT